MFLARFILFAVFIISMQCNHGVNSLANAPEAKEIPSLAIYVDAGSSGARLGIYHISSNKDAYPVIKEVGSKTVDGGVHTLAKSLQEIPNYFEPLLKFAEEQIEDLSNVPIYIFGTGGMRSLPKEDHKELRAAIEHFFKEVRQFKHVQVKTITGDEEGVFGWLTVNYLMDVFSPKNAGKETFGVMDVGGATLQIAFELEDGDTSQEHVETVKLNDKEYRVYIHSYRDFGQNIALKNPMISEKCLASNYTNLEHRAKNCFEAILGFTKERCPDLHYCGLDDVSQPRIHSVLIGIGGVSYTARDLGVQEFSLSFLKKKAKEICSHSDEELERFKFKHVDDQSALCFRTNFYRAVLYGSSTELNNGFGLKEDETLSVPDQINGQKSFSWLTGAVFYNSMQMKVN